MKNGSQKAWDWITNATYLSGALGCFGLSIYSIWLDRAGSAGVAATFAVAFLFLRHLPVIESFKAFNMEAKFARRVGEFDKLLAYIRSVAEVTSRLLYLQLAYSGRMASIDWGRKREFIEELDRNLVELGVDADFIQTAKRPLLNFASWDLYRVFQGCAHVVSERLRREIAQAQHEITAGGPIDPANAEWTQLHERNLALIVPHLKIDDMSASTPLEDMRGITKGVLDNVPYPPKDRAVLERIATEVQELAATCWDQAIVTREAQRYIERYGKNQGDRLKEIEDGSATTPAESDLD